MILKNFRTEIVVALCLGRRDESPSVTRAVLTKAISRKSLRDTAQRKTRVSSPPVLSTAKKQPDIATSDRLCFSDVSVRCHFTSFEPLMSRVLRAIKKKFRKGGRLEKSKSCMDGINTTSTTSGHLSTDEPLALLDSGLASLHLSGEEDSGCSVFGDQDSQLFRQEDQSHTSSVPERTRFQCQRTSVVYTNSTVSSSAGAVYSSSTYSSESSYTNTQGQTAPPHSQTEFHRPYADLVSLETARPSSCRGLSSLDSQTPSRQTDMSTSEMFPDSALSTPIGALRKSRERLALWLNIEQIAVDGNLTPDYMGLAELLGFDAIEIQNFWEKNPTHDLFVKWARAPEKQPFLWKLLECLEKLGRNDILQECQGLILEDVTAHIAEVQLRERYTVGRLLNFDCYVNIADEDLMTIGREIIDTLEGVYGLRLCLTLRDVTLGGFEFENMATMLETRCNSKVLIILSKYYEQSDACQFLTQFAVTLDPGARKNKLIPVLVDENVFIPRVLRCLAMLNYHRDLRLGFLWPRLYAAIRQ